ncbi:aconitase X catalytic domain-containing protein [Ammoniphilus resinae]|uniref:aconitate hydratase n=1 Tax=Ammoniphilus resinae TaxID=861532 RepID=A0ABS4GSJ7_9BACL|nr:aconitase X catalytic domain-containing protein [Ammoniphilus resinae]MBP1933260.1 putative aconitase [Ammoniphilus resinae]
MILTDEQNNILHGSQGPLLQKYMQWMVRWGTAMNAERLVPVHNVHVSGVSAPGHMVIGMPDGVMKGMKEQIWDTTSFKVKAPTYTHVARITLDYADERGLEPDQQQFQHEIIERARKAGIVLTWSCAPYLVGVLPGKGQICAWTESSAVIYANSILGARTTRNGQESATAAAALGVVPEFGVLLDKNRVGEILISVETDINNSLDFGLAGYFAGELAGLKIPVFEGLPSIPVEAGKQISAALATSGGVTMFHAIGVTPEASSFDQAFQGGTPKGKYVFDGQAKKEVLNKLNTIKDGMIDHVMIGCPHASLDEIRTVADLLDGRKVDNNIRLEVWTPRAIRRTAEDLGYLQVIEEAGGKVLSDSCPAISRVSQGKAMATHSCKQAHYSQQLLGNKVALGTIEQCVNSAIEGRWLS